MERRIGRMNLHLMVIIAAICMLPSCSSKVSTSKVQTLATVNGEKVTVRDLREFLGIRAGAYKAFGMPEEKKKSALESLIASKLLAEESRKRGYENDVAFKKRVDEGLEDLYISSLLRERVGSKVHVDEGKIREESKKILEKNKTLGIEVALKQAADKLYGETFREKDKEVVDASEKGVTVKEEEGIFKKISSGAKVNDDTAVASIQGKSVTFGELKKELSAIAGHNLGDLAKDEKALRAIISRIKVKRNLYELAVKEKVGEREAFKHLKNNFENSILISLMIEKDIKSKTRVTVEDAKKEYETHPEMFTQKAQVKARHILLKDEKTAKEVLVKLKGGGDFKKLASEFSQGPSASKGGELGYFSKGRMVKPFEETAFSLKVGEISKPVKTKFGYHIIQVTERKKEKVIPFKDIKDRWIQYLTDRKVNEKVQSLLQGLRKKGDVKIVESLVGAV
jgi:parvulin-like peptidyl-prolyl isomerase